MHLVMSFIANSDSRVLNTSNASRPHMLLYPSRMLFFLCLC